MTLKYNWKTSSSLPEEGRKPFRENTAAKIQKFRYTNKNVKKYLKYFVYLQRRNGLESRSADLR